MKARTSILAVAVVASLVGAACSGDEAESAATTGTSTTLTSVVATTTTAVTTTTVAETTTTVPANRDAGIVAPATATYGHVEFTVTGAEYSNAEPGRYLDEDPKLAEVRHLYVRLTADYENGYPGRSDRFDVGDFSLILDDGTTLVSEQVSFKRTLAVTVDDPLGHALAFPAEDLDLTNAIIVYDDEVHRPMSIDLSGNAVADIYPSMITIGETAVVSYEGGCSDGTGTVNVLDGEWDIDAGVDQDGETIVTAGTARTEGDSQFLRLRVQAIAQSGSCGGTLMTDDTFRLFIDGLPTGSINAFVAKLDDGEGVEMIYGYRVPLDAEELAFEAGLPEGTTALVSIPAP